MKPYRKLFSESNKNDWAIENVLGEILQVKNILERQNNFLAGPSISILERFSKNLNQLMNDQDFEIEKLGIMYDWKSKIAKEINKWINFLLKHEAIGTYKKSGKIFLVNVNNPNLLAKQSIQSPVAQNVNFKVLKTMPQRYDDDVKLFKIASRKVQFKVPGQVITHYAWSNNYNKRESSGFTEEDVIPEMKQKFETGTGSNMVKYVRDTLTSMNMRYTEDIKEEVGELTTIGRDGDLGKYITLTLTISW
jgi:hypothetical protein